MSAFFPAPLPATVRSAAVLLFTALSACAPAGAQSLPSPSPVGEEPEGGTLTVSGQAQVQLPAERVTISFTVETESASAQEASASNAQQMERVFEALRGVGGETMEMETFGYTLDPEYRRPTQGDPSGRTISGYRVRNNVRATLDQVERAGELLDAAISAGANQVLGLQFSAIDTRGAHLQALEMAVTRVSIPPPFISTMLGSGSFAEHPVR